MQSLLGHGVANEITPLLRALERDHTEWKTRDAMCEMRLFVPRSDSEKVDLVCRGMASPGSGDCIVLEACLPVPFLTSSVTASGPLRRPAALRRSAFRTPLPEQVWAPAPECTTWHLGVAPTRIASQGVTRADREFKNGDTIMYLTVMWNWGRFSGAFRAAATHRWWESAGAGARMKWRRASSSSGSHRPHISASRRRG